MILNCKVYNGGRDLWRHVASSLQSQSLAHAGAARVFDLSNAAYLFAGRAMVHPPRPVLRWTAVDTGIGEHDSNATA